ncbi:clr-1 [Penicillium brevicompactum]
MTEQSPDLPNITVTPERSTKRKASTATPGEIYPRKRAATACQICRRRKTRCDNVRPTCGFCADIGATCSYQPTGQESNAFDPASMALLEKMNYVVSLLETQRTHPVEGIPATTPDTSTNTVSPRGAINTHDDHISASSQVLSHCNLSCRVLQWPILQNPRHNGILDSMFVLEKDDLTTQVSRSRWVIEENFPTHVRAFLANVHTKNPVVEHKALLQHANDISENGISWDGPSCLVLLTSALGIISTTFQRVSTTQQAPPEADRSLADSCYFAARKRIGLLSISSLLYLQCYFLSGIYEMYTLKPLEAWHSFYVVSTAIPPYIRTRNPGSMSTETSDLEERLFWSASKSEFELRIELDLPALLGPEPSFPVDYPNPPAGGDDIPEEFPLEESWYYYLFEVSQKRTMDQVIGTFYSSTHDTKLLQTPIESLIHNAMELERHQTLAASRLPPWLQFKEGEASDRELPYFIRTRSLAVQDGILRPFLFLGIHSTTLQPPAVYAFAQRCLEGCYAIIDLVNIQHRHHGSWFQARAAFRCGLSIIAAKKSQRVAVRSDWRQFAEKASSILEFWGRDALDLQRLGVLFRSIYEEMLTSD